MTALGADFISLGAATGEQHSYILEGRGLSTVNQQTVRRTTASSGRIALTVVAILSMLMTLLVIARPAIAFHEGEGNEGPEVTPTPEEFAGGEPQCPAGMTAIRFNDPTAGDDADVELSDGSVAIVTIISSNGELTFEVENGLAAIVKVKGGVSTPGVNDQNVYDYTSFPGGGIAHDDGLTTPNQQGVSHVDFCLVPLPKGSILIYKDDQTGAPVEGAIFSVKNDADEELGPIETDADGFACLDDLPFGDYDVTETDAPDGWLPDPDTETVTVDTESTCDDRLEGAVPADADATFTNTLLGSLLVLKTDGTDPLDGAVFTVEDGEGDPINGPFTSGDDGAGLFCVDGLVFGDEYTVTETDAPDGYSPDPVNPKTHVIDNSDDCATRLAETEIDPDLTFVNTLVPTGSITVVKEITCEICETFTPGAFFNQGENNEMSAFAQDSLSDDPIEVAGLTFDSVQSVQDNAPPGSLLRHYLALALNLRLAADSECDLANLVYDGSVEALQGMTVGQIAAEAEAVLNGEDSDFTEEQLHDAIDEINNNHGAEDGVLVCEAEGSTDGFEFTLFNEAEEEVDSGATVDGTVTFSDLPFGTYTLVETGGPEGSDCSVVSASGEGVTFDDETGVITIVLTENNADVTVTVVNECEQLPPPQLGSITIIKNAIPDDAQDFAFTTTGSGLSNFSLDDDADATLSNQVTFDDLAAGPYSVTESATAGWDLTSINCSAGGTGDATTGTASITIVGSENVTCTFVNEEEDQVGGQLGSITIIKNAVPDAAQDFAFTTTGSGLSNFSLDDDADAALSNQRTFTGLAAGPYTVVEAATTGWTLTSITCSAGGTGDTTTRTASITLGTGQNVTCTFVNTQQGSGTQGGNPPSGGTLANTAADLGTAASMPAALLALVMLTGLTAAAYAARAEVRRRR
jgi:hypothetical protein